MRVGRRNLLRQRTGNNEIPIMAIHCRLIEISQFPPFQVHPPLFTPGLYKQIFSSYVASPDSHHCRCAHNFGESMSLHLRCSFEILLGIGAIRFLRSVSARLLNQNIVILISASFTIHIVNTDACMTPVCGTGLRTSSYIEFDRLHRARPVE